MPCCASLKNPEAEVEEIMEFIKGPDFPTGGIILQESDSDEMVSAYATGRGKVTLRGKVHLEEMGRGKSRVIITELPYQTNKSALIERIAELARDGNIDGISDLRDESDRQGMRIVIELSKAAEESNILRELYRRTPLQTTFRISLLALVDGQPRLLALKQALRVYLEHRIDVTRRRTQFDLDKARQRAHILEGLRVALNNLDEVIQIIRRAQDVEEARIKLMKRFKLSEIQASAILEMQLRRLAALERKKIETEYKDLLALIKELEGLLKSAKKLRQVVGDELSQIKQTYGDKRRTQIVSLKAGAEVHNLLTTNDLTPAQTVWVGLTEEGLIGRTMGDKLPRVSGRQAPVIVYKTSTHHTLYLVDAEGRTAAIAVQSLPETESFMDGIPVNKAAPFPSNPKIKKIFSLPARVEDGADWTVVTVTQGGMIKKSSLSDLPGPSTQLFTLVKVNEGDAVQSVFLVNGKSDCVLATSKGMTIRFSENDVRVMGLVAAGVNGIKLSEGDEVVSAFRYDEQMDMLLVAANGKAWRIPDNQLPLQGRYGQGTTTCKVGTTTIVGVLHGYPETEGLAHLAQLATKPIVINQITSGKRQSAPKLLIQTRPGDYLAWITALEDGISDWEPKKRRTEKKSGGSTTSKLLDIPEKDHPVSRVRKEPVSKKSGTEQISIDKVEQPALFPEESKRGRKTKTVKTPEQITTAKVKSQVRTSPGRSDSSVARKPDSEAPKPKTIPGRTSKSTGGAPTTPKQRGRPKGSGTKTTTQTPKPKTATKAKPVRKSTGRKPRPKTAEGK